jgi:hypothetical protein
MDEGYLALMIPIVACIGIFIVIIYVRRFQNMERLAMIEKGVDPQFLNMRQPANTSWSLRLALLLIGSGTGLLMGNFLERILNLQEEVAYFSMLFIFGGIGLMISYIIEEKKLKERKL